ncbi:hypothetical protein PSENEW3_00000068 [Picochlorum sp. SENEW3]|nr:hypothetical protein PSENEW3_00000068 [Picochlorum sp. SENEW3]
MLREQRGSTPLSAKANGLSGVDMTRPETTKNGGVKDENMTPNHCQNDVQIKAWQGRRQSSIPSPPNAEAVAVTPKHGVDEVPVSSERVSTLQAIKNQLQGRLDHERQRQIDAVKELEFLGGEQGERCANLRDEVSSRGTKIMVLSQKLTRAQHTLGSLQRATDDYEASAKKVKDAEQVLEKRQKNAASMSLSLKESRSIRHELDAATAMMSAACQRVEQIESITDSLISQLSKTENELADLQHLRDTELVKHSAEIEKLAHERDCLALQLSASDSASHELRQKEKELNAKLADAKATAKKLAEELDKADREKAEKEAALTSKANRLERSLREVEESKMSLEKELEVKQHDLQAAKKVAAEGTPKSKGAKQVLPMALKKLKGAQEELTSVRDEREKALKDLEYAQQLAAAREETLQEHMKAKTETEAKIQEQQGALESMMKAAASAANDAALKQEEINKLRIEIASVQESKQDILDEMTESKEQCEELSAKLAMATAQQSAATNRIVQLKEEYNKAQALTLEKEILTKTQLEDYAKQADASRTKMAAYKDTAKKIRVSLQNDLEISENKVASANAKVSGAEAELNQVLSQVSEISDQIRSMEESKTEISVLLQAKEVEINTLSTQYGETVRDLKQVIKQKDAAIEALEHESLTQKDKIAALSQEMESLRAAHEASRVQSEKTIADLSALLDQAKEAEKTLQEKYLALEQRSTSQISKASEEIESLTVQLTEAIKIKESLEQALQKEKETHSDESKKLLDHCENLERSNERLMESIQNLGEQLILKDEDLSAAKLEGTPKGEAAKEILKRTLSRVQELQDTVAALESQCGDQSMKISALREENEKIPGLEATACNLESKLKIASDESAATSVKLQQSEDKLSHMHDELQVASDKLLAEVKSKNSIKEEFEEKVRNLEDEIAREKDVSQNLRMAKTEGEQQIKSLRAQLKETKDVLMNMKKNEETSSETLQLTFLKVKELEEVIEDQSHEVECLNSKLEYSIESESKLRFQIKEIEIKHTADIESLNQTISSQEKNISRLRLELLDEVSASNKLKANLEASESQIATLEEQNRHLDSTVVSMKSEMKSFEAQLTEKQEALESILAAKDSITAEMTSKIETALREKDVAYNQVEEMSKKMREAKESLQLVTSQAKAYERSSSAKERTISEQKDLITNLEKNSYTLSEELKKMKTEVDQKDAKLKQLGQAKMKAEIELEEDIALLKQEIAIQQERSQQKNLAEAAAEKSAQLLQQTQARTHIRLAATEKTVNQLNEENSSLEQKLTLKSNHVLELCQQVHAKAQAAHVLEAEFARKQAEMKKALSSAQWLATVTKARYESEIQHLTEKVELLEKRCMHVEALERQNAELCALMRERKPSPQPIQSHPMQDVETISSPPSKGMNRTTVAAISVAGVAVIAAAQAAARSCGSSTLIMNSVSRRNTVVDMRARVAPRPHVGHVNTRSPVLTCASNRSTNTTEIESFDLLQSFFYGKALAEVLNERLGNMAADVLAEFGTAEAELRKMLGDIQDEVAMRAEREIQESRGGVVGQKDRNGALLPPVVEEDEAVDNLRAEIASTRALIQQTRMQQNKNLK